MSFKIEKIHLNCNWEWDIYNSDCAICRGSLCENISKDQEGSVVGECGHAFHYQCISNWLRSKNVCPLCNQLWKYKKK